MFLRPLKLIYFILLLLFSWFASALPKDSQQHLKIISDSWTVNYKTGVHQYEGDVKVDQGTSHLIADRLITKNSARHKINEVIAYGLKTLAEYWTVPKTGDKEFHAKAEIIKGYPPFSTLIFEGNVTVTQGENSFHGPLIIYNTITQVVTAPANTSGRATIVINPTT